MALRVLLADESTTIKKVIQLTLQDFAVDVKAVHVGVDVLEVAKSFDPEIIFVDVLLQKKNGYDVIAELKNDPKLKKIPTVLMWSSFMQLDEKLATSCGADARLEKPFDAETLRQIVLQRVPKTHSQRLAHFLQFPPSIGDGAKKPAAAAPPPAQAGRPVPSFLQPPLPPAAATPAKSGKDAPITLGSSSTDVKKNDPIALGGTTSDGNEPPSNWNMESFEEISRFAPEQEDTAKISVRNEPEPAQEENEAWSHQDLAKFKLDLPEIELTTSIGEGDAFEIEMPTTPRAERPDMDDHPLEHSLGRIEIDLEAQEGEGSADLLEIEDNYHPRNADSPEVSAPKPPPAQPIQPRAAVAPAKPPVPESRKSAMPPTPAASASVALPELNEEQIEAIIRGQSREIIESLVRKIVPDLATKMIRAELERLLSEQDGDQEAGT